MKKIIYIAGLLSIFFAVQSFAEDLIRVGSSYVIPEGTSYENAVVVGGSLTVNGTVSEDAVVVGGDLNVGITGRVEGETVVVGGDINQEEGSFVANKNVEVSFDFPSIKFFKTAIPWSVVLLIGLIACVLYLALFLFISMIFTQNVGRTSFYIEKRPWSAILSGVLSLIVILPILVILAVSIIGWPLIPVVVVLFICAYIFGLAAICQLVGLKFFRWIRKPGRPMALEVVMGFVILLVISLIPIIGWAIKGIACIAGLGGAVTTRFGTRM